MQSYNARFGLVLFFLYLLLYGSFVGLNAFWPESMEQTPFGGVSLAITWGFGLILAAVLLAFVYGLFCRDESQSTTAEGKHP